eukprot:14570473-Alexandrium_andersonii.AAC.1
MTRHVGQSGVQDLTGPLEPRGSPAPGSSQDPGLEEPIESKISKGGSNGLFGGRAPNSGAEVP